MRITYVETILGRNMRNLWYRFSCLSQILVSLVMSSTGKPRSTPMPIFPSPRSFFCFQKSQALAATVSKSVACWRISAHRLMKWTTNWANGQTNKACVLTVCETKISMKHTHTQKNIFRNPPTHSAAPHFLNSPKTPTLRTRQREPRLLRSIFATCSARSVIYLIIGWLCYAVYIVNNTHY